MSLFLWWLRLTRPRVYHRLIRLWSWQLVDAICNIEPTVFLPKRSMQDVKDLWKVDVL